MSLYLGDSKITPTRTAEIIALSQEIMMLSKENTELKNNGLIGVREGEYIDITDSAEARFSHKNSDGLVIEGNSSKQKTTDGKNLLEHYNLTEKISNGVKFTPIFKDGLLQYINVNGTATGQASYFVSNGYSDENILKGVYADNDTLKILGTGTSDILIYTNKVSIIYGEQTVNITNVINSPLTWFLYRINEGVTINNAKLYPFIYNFTQLGDVGYEPYTGGQASPNPDYPQEIHSVGDNVNLFDKDNVNFVRGWIGNDGTIHTDGDSSISDYIEMNKNIDITISGSIIENISLWDENKQYIKRIMSSNVQTAILNTENASYIILQIATAYLNKDTLKIEQRYSSNTI